jgi:hypothetical protein
VAQKLLGPASWQCSSSRVARCMAVFGFYEYDSHPPPSIITGPRHCDFLLLPKMKFQVKGPRFDSIKGIQTVSQTVIKTLTRNYFHQCFQSWKSSWYCCINAEGDYFEGDGGE